MEARDSQGIGCQLRAVAILRRHVRGMEREPVLRALQTLFCFHGSLLCSAFFSPLPSPWSFPPYPSRSVDSRKSLFLWSKGAMGQWMRPDLGEHQMKMKKVYLTMLFWR